MYLYSLTTKQRETIKKILINEGFDKKQISIFLNSYTCFNKIEELRSGKYNQPKFKEIMEMLNEGNTLDEIEANSSYTNTIDEFKGFLKSQNISIKEALSLFKYTAGSSRILTLKRKTNDFKTYLQELDENLYLSLRKLGKTYNFDYSRENIDRFIDYAKNLDYANTSSEQCQILMYKFINENNMPNTTHYAFMKYIQDLAEYHSISPIINTMEETLQNQLPFNMLLYRAVGVDVIFNLNGHTDNFKSLVGKKIEETGFSSCSMLYETSFARYPQYPIVFKILTPKASKGFNVTPVSNYHYENEILLNSNDMYILDCDDNFIDEKQERKILFTVFLLSKDRECYKDVGKKNIKKEYDDEENS